MSRSRKKVPSSRDYSRANCGTRYSKRLASKAVRNYKGEISNGTQFKKIFCSYNIFDYKFRCWDKYSDWYEELKDSHKKYDRRTIITKIYQSYNDTSFNQNEKER